MNPTNVSDWRQREEVQKIVTSICDSRKSIVEEIAPYKYWNGDRLLVETLEWGWEHAAPVGKRYRPRETQNLEIYFDFNALAQLHSMEVIRQVTVEVDALLERAKTVAASRPVDQIYLMVRHPLRPEASLTVFVQLVFMPTSPEPETAPKEPLPPLPVRAVEWFNV